MEVRVPDDATLRYIAQEYAPDVNHPDAAAIRADYCVEGVLYTLTYAITYGYTIREYIPWCIEAALTLHWRVFDDEFVARGNSACRAWDQRGAANVQAVLIAENHALLRALVPARQPLTLYTATLVAIATDPATLACADRGHAQPACTCWEAAVLPGVLRDDIRRMQRTLSHTVSEVLDAITHRNTNGRSMADCIRRLLPYVGRTGGDGFSVHIFQAIHSDNVPIIRELLGSGANANVREPGTGLTPLHAVCSVSSNMERVYHFIALLVRAGGDVNAPDNDGETPLGRALRLNNQTASFQLQLAGAMA